MSDLPFTPFNPDAQPEPAAEKPKRRKGRPRKTGVAPKGLAAEIAAANRKHFMPANYGKSVPVPTAPDTELFKIILDMFEQLAAMSVEDRKMVLYVLGQRFK